MAVSLWQRIEYYYYPVYYKECYMYCYTYLQKVFMYTLSQCVPAMVKDVLGRQSIYLRGKR